MNPIEEDTKAITKQVKEAFFLMLLYSMIVALSAVIVAHCFNMFYPLSPFIASLLEFIGYICWGTSLGAQGSGKRKSKGNLHAEKISRQYVLIISMLGIFVFVVAQVLTT